MGNIAIKVENLSKQYRIGAQQERYQTLRDALVKNARRLFGRAGSRPSDNTILALKDVSFEVQQGEVLGIIGRNGAGKSTLLKILSHITEPTEGRVSLFGRVGSLLEVGTGFHPELTGRENIFLNGAIMGMRRAEIVRKFDQIVDFAGIEKFIDTPVKHYSSGMYVRLAFAVAAHLEPEILLVDEVLAVGDAEFQKKCLGKMGNIAQEGRTVILVSHNMGAIQTLCPNALLLEKGKLFFSGDSFQVVSKYMGSISQSVENPFENCERSGNGELRITSFHLESLDGKKLSRAVCGEPLTFVFGYKSENPMLRNVSVGFSVHDNQELGIFYYYSNASNIYFNNLKKQGYFKCKIDEFSLKPGNYLIGVRVVAQGQELDWPKVYVPFTAVMGDFYHVGNFEGAMSNWGYLLVRGTWSIG